MLDDLFRHLHSRQRPILWRCDYAKEPTEVWLEQIEAKLDYERWYFAHYHTEKEVGKIRIMHNDYTMIPHEASVAAEKDMIRRMHRQAEIAEALGLLDDAPNQKNGDDIS